MLRTIPLFKDLTDLDLAVITEMAIDQELPKGKIVISEGQSGDAMYAILSGKVKVFMGDNDGREIILKILGPGDFFGEMSMIDQQPRSASVATIENTMLKVLTQKAFQTCLDRAPRIATTVMQALAKRLRDADRKISTLALMDVYGRVANTLLDLAIHSNGKRMVGEKLSQSDIANMVGASREMVNRILKDLSERGYISIEAKEITIHNENLPPSF